MSLKDMSKESLSLLSYVDIAYQLLKENKITLKTPDLFRKVCDLLEFNDSQYASKIGDFYTSLTIDKRFIVLENNEWDLRENHSVELVLDDDEIDETLDEEVEDDIVDEEIVLDDEQLENVDEIVDDDLDDDDDLDNLTIVDEDEETEE